MLARALLLGFLLAAWSQGQPAATNTGQHSEYQVKAAFLLNFTKFVDWPETQFRDTGAPLEICILGEDPFGPVLDEIVSGEIVNGRRVVVERLREDVPGSCHVLFVNKPEKDLPQILAAVGPGVLTVGEGRSFVSAGGIIAFAVENRRVRFDINQRAAQRSILKMSSRLLNVARSIEK